MRILLLSLLFCGSVVLSSAELSCRDESGKAVDWYIVYKIPKQGDQKPPLTTGFSYAYITPNADSFKLSQKLVTDESSIFGQTLAPLHAQPSRYSHVMYNDAPPEGAGKDSSTWAHAKGVFALDKESGFWLIHSIPKFARPPQDKYEYPDSGQNNGQTALCISIKTDAEGADMVKQLKHLTPNIYSHFETQEVLQKLPDFKDLGAKKYKTATEESVGEITSAGKVNFLSFARTKKAAAAGDLYSVMVAPYLKAPLAVETWRRGAGGPLASNCKDKYSVSNVNEMKINFSKDSAVSDSGVWPYIRDHAKWAISQDKMAPYVCIGDINRMESQFKRGGGTVCIKDPHVWTVFSQAIHETEACKK